METMKVNVLNKKWNKKINHFLQFLNKTLQKEKSVTIDKDQSGFFGGCNLMYDYFVELDGITLYNIEEDISICLHGRCGYQQDIGIKDCDRLLAFQHTFEIDDFNSLDKYQISKIVYQITDAVTQLWKNNKCCDVNKDYLSGKVYPEEE